ncbi:MAG: CopG family transcriptional regulator [Rubrivivax sp.]
MSTTTTVRVPESLRVRVESMAAARGSTVHAFMLEAIAEATDRLERRQDFEAEAARRLQHMQNTGEYLTLADLRKHATRLARKADATAPKPRTLPADTLTRLKSAIRRAG